MSSPRATYALACSLSHQLGNPSSVAVALASSSTTPWGWNTASMSRSPTRVVCKRHRRSAEDVDVSDDTPARQALAEPTEGLLDGATIEERVVGTHATSSSCAAT